MSKNKEESQKIEKMHQKQKSAIMALIALAFILAGANLWTFFYYVPNKNNESDLAGKLNAGKYNFLDPARGIYDKKDLIVNIQPLRDYLGDKYEADPNISVYFEYLPTGANISVSKDAEFYPASLLKVPIAMAAAKKIDKGEWRWDNKLVLMATDKDDKFGDLYNKPTGSVFTIEELARRSLIDSDNTAHFILLRNMEPSEINEVYAHMGLDGFLETDGSISAKRYSVILRALYNSSYLSEANSQKIISFLSEEPFREYLGSGFPENIVFAHKIGMNIDKKVYIDSGIIYFDSRPYILVVMTKSKTEQEAKEVMKDISEKVFNYVKEYKE
ncbi:MAG: serine hydrolase [bacterium]|nr:serine hydrolase [bacterium]